MHKIELKRGSFGLLLDEKCMQMSTIVYTEVQMKVLLSIWPEGQISMFIFAIALRCQKDTKHICGFENHKHLYKMPTSTLYIWQQCPLSIVI